MVKTSIDRYRLIQSLGSGSQGESFLATIDDDPRQRVVVKVMHSHNLRHASHRRQMEREVQTLSRLCHPYIVRLIESRLSDPEAPSLVMEYVHGITLAENLKRVGRLNVTDAAWVAGCVCHALDAAHAKGIVHRDLKPANIMRSDPGTLEESVRVMDFGYAASTDRVHISPDRLSGSEIYRSTGTPAYIAPEQLRGEPVDHRSDFYSLGIVMFEMLTGFHPFPYADAEQVLRAQLRQAPPTFASLRVFDIPPRLEELVARCLSKYPADRPASGRALANELGWAIGYDVWEGTRPLLKAEAETSANFDASDEGEPGTRSEIRLGEAHSQEVATDPLSSVYYFDAWLPEALAVMKLQGFLSEFGGHLRSSEPGMIRLRIGRIPVGGMLGRLLIGGDEPVDIDLRMEKTAAKGNLLRLTAHFHPPKGYRVRRPGVWRMRCAYLYRDLSAYLMARN